MGQATFVQEGLSIDYTPAVDVPAAAVIVLGKMVCVARRPIPANTKGALACEGMYDVVKANLAFKTGDEVYWNAKGDPQGGTAGSGAATLVSEGNVFMGFAALDAAAGDATVRVCSEGTRSGARVYTQVAASGAVSNTNVETDFDKSFTFPAGTLKAGDAIRVRGQVIAPATNATDTLTIKVKLGNTVIATLGPLDVANNDVAVFDLLLIVRTDGANGTLVAAGSGTIGTPATATLKPIALASQALDTTADQKLSVSATWSVVNAGNSCRMDVLQVERLAA